MRIIVQTLLAGAVIFSPAIASADNSRISPIRKAAIERMQAKLGSIRGTIQPDTRNILLTRRMIDMLKPVRPGEGVGGVDTLTTAGTVSRLPVPGTDEQSILIAADRAVAEAE